MRLITGVADEVGLLPIHLDKASPQLLALADARRRARAALVALWAGFGLAALLLPADTLLAIAVLLAGVSMVLETTHGVLAFDNLLRRLLAGQR
jgi:hypothetical protein